jgi:hypothetical protein
MNLTNHPATMPSTVPVVETSQSDGDVVFPDRRHLGTQNAPPVIERRQFGNTHSELSPDARELGQAIDQYKLVHRRRFITYEEMLNVIRTLGYHK